MDLCRSFVAKRPGKVYLLVMTDRFTKLMRTTSLKMQTAEAVVKAFARNWVLNYEPPHIGHSGDHDGRTESFNRNLVGAVRKYCADNPRRWDRHTDALTHAYNTEVNETTKHAPFDLVLAAQPLPMYTE